MAIDADTAKILRRSVKIGVEAVRIQIARDGFGPPRHKNRAVAEAWLEQQEKDKDAKFQGDQIKIAKNETNWRSGRSASPP